jgi:hypothetical protein
MTAKEIATRLVELCRAGKFHQAMEELYSPDIVSVEPHEMPGMGRTMKGLPAVKGKAEWWVHNHEIHSMKVGDPFVSPEAFVVEFDMDVTNKKMGKRIKGSEVGYYKVDGGKIVHEEFLGKM